MRLDSLQNAQDILDFWFFKETQKNWFIQSDDFDKILKQKFYDLYCAAKEEKLEKWQENPKSSLALIILLDQCPRHFFRNDSRAFETDHLALSYAKHALNNGYDIGLSDDEKAFIYLPLEHSEDLSDQEICVSLFEERTNSDLYVKYAQQHRDIIRRFGRFPHRNKILARKNTDEEEAFLKEKGRGF